MTRFFDLSNLKVTIGSDDEPILNGYMVSIADVKPNDTISIASAIFKENRGQYIIPALEINRNDLCKALFNPFEAWHQYVKHMEKFLKCPNVKGTIYRIPSWSTKANVSNIPDPNLSGAYRSVMHFAVVGNEKISMCAVFNFHMFLIDNL
ncbi:uncharacterized protein LOC129919582 [Episyrphus balteatus]|uniref:uncharacterized protein LOC129919582 n=1 Tax=Episyrphus balteatus TaxID=286459 RepID=UPI002485ADEA|nr:uncharacterized protein LOC129919582 [Episyrphus balteatus]